MMAFEVDKYKNNNIKIDNINNKDNLINYKAK